MTPTERALRRRQDQIRRLYRSAIGQSRRDVITPALILDLGAVRRNIKTMADRTAGQPAKLRPHVKGHKSPELARLQVEAGAVGVCAATVWEALAMSASGIDDVLIANEVGHPEKIRALAAAARRRRFTVAIDNPRSTTQLAEALRAARAKLEVLIEVDIGMGRGGVRSPEDAVALAEHVSRLPQLRLRGVQGYEGHCMLETDVAKRAAVTGTAIDRLGLAVERLGRAGFACEVVSAGGTGTYDMTGRDPRVTEIQVGSYVFMDRFHAPLVSGFETALTVAATVTIQHGRTIVLDAGRKSVSIDFHLPCIVAYPKYPARYFAEEHGMFDLDEHCPLGLGDRVELISGYAPASVNLYDAYHVVENDVVVDIWPIVPRGPSHLGFAAG